MMTSGQTTDHLISLCIPPGDGCRPCSAANTPTHFYFSVSALIGHVTQLIPLIHPVMYRAILNCKMLFPLCWLDNLNLFVLHTDPVCR